MDIFFFLILVALILLIPTAYAGFIGAPYAPTFTPAIKQAFDYIKIGPKDTIIDLGAGDGKVLLEAARRGAKAKGFELSPIMWFVTWLRLLIMKTKVSGTLKRRFLTPYNKPKIYLRNFYKQSLKEATVVFAFLMPQNMNRVRKYLSKQHIPQGKYLLVYAFPLENVEPLHVVKAPKCAPLYVYDLPKLTRQEEAG